MEIRPAVTKLTVFGAVLSGLTFLMSCAMAGDQSSERFVPPRQYQLEDVAITILHQTSHRIPGSYKISIGGDGQGSYTSGKAGEKKFTLKGETLLELLNDFYRIHFFELKDTWTVKNQVALLDDNSILVSPMRLVDVSSKQICLALADYNKCVTVVGNQPAELSNLISKIESLVNLD